MKKKKTPLLSSLMGGEKRRHYVAAYVTNEGEWNQHEPNTGFAKMFIAMLILHVLIIGGIILSDSGTKKTAPRSPAAAAMMTKGKDEISGSRVASVVETSSKDDGTNYETYQVRSADSLPMIAARFGVDQTELVALNGLENADFGAGTVLKIPNNKVKAPLQVSAARPLNVGITTPTSTPVATHTEPQPETSAAATEAPAAPQADTAVSTDASSPPEKNSALVVLTSATDDGNGLVPLPDVATSTSTSTEAAEPAVEPLKVEESPPPASNEPEASSKSDNIVSTEKPKEKEKPIEKKTVAAVAAPRPVPPPSEMTKRPINKTDKSDKADSPPKTAKTETKPSKGGSYTMAKGDTLYRISAKFGVSVQSLMKANNVKDPAKIRDGTKLVIPSKS